MATNRTASDPMLRALAERRSARGGIGAGLRGWRKVVQALLAGAAATTALSLLEAVLHSLLEGGDFQTRLLFPPPSSLGSRLALLAAVTGGLLHLIARRENAQVGRLFFTAVEEAPDGIQLADLSGQVVYANLAAERILGFSAQALRGSQLSDLNLDRTLAKREIVPALQERGRWLGEVQVRHGSGKALSVWLSTSLVRRKGGRPVALLAILRDISERQQQQADLARYADELKEANELKDLFTDILRHDLLNPANAIRLSGKLLQCLVRGERETEALDGLMRSVDTLTDIAQAASTYAKLERRGDLERTELDLLVVLDGVSAQFQQQLQAKRQTLRRTATCDGVIRASPMIEEAVANLISNAIKYSPEDRQIDLRLEDVEGGCRLAVIDRGPGVPEEFKPKLFTRFHRVGKEGVEGTGLGLAIVKRLVELHGGSVGVEDNPLGGSVFWLTLPRG